MFALLFGGDRFDDSIDHIKAVLLVHAIRNSPGGHKLSNEMVLWLATHFEECFLPGTPQAMAELIADAQKNFDRYNDRQWYDLERRLELERPPSAWRRVLEWLKRCATRFS